MVPRLSSAQVKIFQIFVEQKNASTFPFSPQLCLQFHLPRNAYELWPSFKCFVFS